MEADETLMVRVQRGDGRALEALVGRYERRLFGFLARRGEHGRAEDLFQETWLRVVRGRTGFDPGRRFSTWLYQIANNLCRDLARRRAVETRELLTLHDSASAGSRSGAPPADVHLDVRRRLLALPERLREVLVLRYFEGLAESEIAAVVGVPPGTVKSRLHAALRALRGQEAPGDGD
jgi:RNA polymerase sigma-70 factor (ECF subfamily)